MKPGQQVDLRIDSPGNAPTEYQLVYRSVTKQTSMKAIRYPVSVEGKRLIHWASGFMSVLKSATYSARSGLLTIQIGRTVSAPEAAIAKARVSSSSG
jgi:hypothetical protein